MVGKPYTVAARLCLIASDHWPEIDGEAAFKGVNLLELRLDRFCNAIYWWTVQRVEDREQFDYQLHQPVPGRVTQEDVDRELDDFSSLVGKFGGAK